NCCNDIGSITIFVHLYCIAISCWYSCFCPFNCCSSMSNVGRYYIGDRVTSFSTKLYWSSSGGFTETTIGSYCCLIIGIWIQSSYFYCSCISIWNYFCFSNSRCSSLVYIHHIAFGCGSRCCPRKGSRSFCSCTNH